MIHTFVTPNLGLSVKLARKSRFPPSRCRAVVRKPLPQHSKFEFKPKKIAILLKEDFTESSVVTQTYYKSILYHVGMILFKVKNT